MNYSRLRTWLIITFSLFIIAIVVRAIWQIVKTPTAGTMLIFIPLILAILGIDALLAYLIFSPQKFKSLPLQIGTTVALTAGLFSTVIHFAHFVSSPEAEPILSKIVASLVILCTISAYAIILWVIWSFRRVRKE